MSHFSPLEPALPAPTRPDWPRAFRALRVIRADPDRTDQVFELNVALDGGDSERQFQALLAEPGGADLLRDSPELLDHLTDVAALEALPPDTLGAAYLALMRANAHDPDGLHRAAERIQEFAALHRGAARTWWMERQSCVHDLLHLLTGYGQDQAGETALLAFTDGLYGRRHRMRVVRFGMIASVLSAPWGSKWRTLVFAWQARRRGKRSRIPFGYRWEEALKQPTKELRAQLGVAPPAA